MIQNFSVSVQFSEVFLMTRIFFDDIDCERLVQSLLEHHPKLIASLFKNQEQQ